MPPQQDGYGRRMGNPLDVGLYEHLLTTQLGRRLADVDPDLLTTGPVDAVDSADVLAAHLGGLARRALRAMDGRDPADKLRQQVRLVNRLAAAMDHVDEVLDPAQLLLAVTRRAGTPGRPTPPPRPLVPLATSALLVNGHGQPRIGHEVDRELQSADRVDLLCAFIKWAGLRVLEAGLSDLNRRGVPLRVITTTYIGATDPRAVDRLVELGAEVRVSYETRSTRLHAKAWLFHRNSGLSTGYVGSSNLSAPALTDGLEWNVRLSAAEQGHLLDTFDATFESYWADPSFEPYDPTRDGDRLRAALSRERSSDLPIELTALDVRPYGYQREILDALAAEREVHDRWRNLVVMATGTGKTVVSALDYRGLARDHGVDSLLFVAHRKELLHQSLATFRHTMRDGSFGELLVDGSRPRQWQHVFASIQSLANLDLTELDPQRFDAVVVDEFHHAEAATYRRLLDHLRPKVLVGLTATPERTDGADVGSWFDGHRAVELRLWEALDRGLLAPFQYFGTHDGVALDELIFRRGRGYDVGDLDNVYTGNDARVALVLRAVADKVEDPLRMRALGFCVSQQHAEFMAARFSAAGIVSRAVVASTNSADRAAALTALRDGSVQVLFTVDLFNEGIDLPTVDTILFLRPTESATVFLQQLGRGLRLADGKACLTVLDFIGAQHRDFRFDLRYRALTGVTRRRLAREIADGFPTLPAGCHVELDRVATEVVLSNVRQALDVRWPGLVAEARGLPGATLSEFLAETGVELEDLYRGQDRGWLALQRAAGHVLQPSDPGADDRALGRAIGRLLHIDDPERLGYLRRVLHGISSPTDERERRMAAMLNATLWGSTEPYSGLERAMERLLAARDRAGELTTVTHELFERIHRVTLALAGSVPLHLHARYNRSEALTAFGVQSLKGTFGSGVYFARDAGADLFFVTLIKTEQHFSPTTMYADAAISPTLFQWESQNATRADSPTGRRYRNHGDEGTSVHLFLRESKDGVLGTAPYLYAGPMDYRSHTGERPMRILWELEHALPADVFATAKVA